MSGEQPRAQEPNGQPWPLADDITLTQLHRSMVELSRSTAAWFQQANRRFDVLHEELALIRSDHGPRITGVEQKAAQVEQKTAHLPSGVKTGAKYGAVAAIIPLLEWLVPFLQERLGGGQ